MLHIYSSIYNGDWSPVSSRLLNPFLCREAIPSSKGKKPLRVVPKAESDRQVQKLSRQATTPASRRAGAEAQSTGKSVWIPPLDLGASAQHTPCGG